MRWRASGAWVAICAASLLLASPAAEALAQAHADDVLSDLEGRFAAAETVFFSVDQADSIALFDTLIEQLGVDVRPDLAPLMIRCLAYRAQANQNLGDEATARTDLQQMLSADPSADVDRDVVSPKFTELFDAVRAETVGYLSLFVSPPDATVQVDGRVLEWEGGPVAVVAGTRAMRIERLGFAAQDTEVDVEASATAQIETTLERTSAVASFTLFPPDSEIQFDGENLPLVQGRPGALNAADEGVISVDGISLGEHLIEVRRDGYRPRIHTVQVDALADHNLGSLELERTLGTIVLRHLPADATVELDGAAITLKRPAEGDLRLDLSPGTYAVEVDAGSRGVFAATLDLGDREEHVVEVKPRPSVALLGVFGDDDLGRDKVIAAAEQALDGHPLWMWQDQTARAAAIITDTDIERATLRDGSAPARERIAALREEIAERVAASAYVLAVLDDDLVATRVDLWIWPGPPGPAAVQMMSFSLVGDRLAEELRNTFSIRLARRRTYFGAQVIDSAASSYPTVIATAEGSPAAGAGLQVGDEISAIDGTALHSAAELSRAIGSAGARDVELVVRRNSSQITMPATLTESAETVLPGVQEVPYGLLWAAIEAHAFLADDPVPDWVLGLDRAAVLLETHQWEDAVRLLRTVRAPKRAGLGQGTVEYWLGLALLQLGPTYTDHARRAFGRAAAITGATLGHDDGQQIGPLARALLTALGS